MDVVIQFLHRVLLDVGPFCLMLGLLIFVHELGHYLVAVLSGVRVETFSLGFGRKIFSFKRGPTTYKIAIIPLGGYVKMYGDDPSAEIPEAERRYAFLKKPLLPRTAIVLAGPLMNLIFAVLLFMAVGMIGQEVPGTQLGDIAPQTMAYAAGFRSGDQIKNINGSPVFKWQDVKNDIESHPGKQLRFEVKGAHDGSTRMVLATPKLEKNGFLFSFKNRIGKINGLTTNSDSTTIGVANPNSIAAKAGLHTFDIIEKIDGKSVMFWRDLGPLLLKTAPGHKVWNLTVQPYNGQSVNSSPTEGSSSAKLMTIKLKIPSALSAQPTKLLKQLGIDRSDMFLLAVKRGSPAAKAGLKVGDKMVAINHLELQKWQQVLEDVKSFRPQDKTMAFTILRNGKLMQFNITPMLVSLPTGQGTTAKRYAVGVLPAVIYITGNGYLEKYKNPVRAFVFGVKSAYHWTKIIAISFLRLVQDKVSARNLGSVISIGRIATRSYEAGLTAFLRMMSIISIDLFLLNLLPVPVLDGGHLLFFAIEAVKGAPLSLRKMEIAQQVGLVLLLSLMIFALFNDISHLMSSW